MIKCCKDCCERQPGCHDRCEKYQSEKAAAQALKAAMRREKKIQDGLTAAEVRMIRRAKQGY